MTTHWVLYKFYRHVNRPPTVLVDVLESESAMKKLLKFPLVLCVIAYARSFPQPLITQLPAPIPSNGTSSLNLTSISALDSDLKRVATMGILFGAVQGEAEMERKLTHQLADLAQTFNVSRPEVKSRKVAALERSMERDKVALGILGGALELATKKTMTYDQYRKEMQKLAEVWVQGVLC